MDFNGQKVLVTGGTGFLGKRLTRSLAAKRAQVFGLYLANDLSPRTEEVTWFEIGDPLSVIRTVAEIRPDFVFHLAAISLAQHKPEQIPDFIQANINFGTYVLEGLRMARLSSGVSYSPVFVTAGSFWQYAEGTSIYAPNSFYASTKMAFSCISKFYREMEDIACMALILPHIYGEGDQRGRILSKLVEIRPGAPPMPLTEGKQIVDFLHVEDAISGFLQAAILLATGGADVPIEYYLHGPSPMTFRSLVDLLSEMKGFSLPISWGAVEYRRREVMRPYRGPILPGWEPVIGLREGLARMVSELIPAR